MASGSADPYVYRDSDVLVNKPGIRDKAALRTFEYEIAALREQELANKPLPEKFDYAHLKAIHKHLFQDVYDWAGQERTTDLSKGGTTFERQRRLDLMGGVISDKIAAQNNLRGLDRHQFVDRLTLLYADLNMLHAFREGNGRSTRAFLGQIARGAGYELDQRIIDREKGEWNLAAKIAVDPLNKDLRPIRDIFREAVRTSRSVAFETLPREEALKRHPELERQYKDLDLKKAQIAQSYPGNEKAQAHFFTQARSEIIRNLDQGAVVQRPPGAVAAVAAIQKKVEHDGLNEQQRRIVMARVEQNANASVQKGQTPNVRIIEDRPVAVSRTRDVER